jgi:GNAT superfamily N-acetyltransferase
MAQVLDWEEMTSVGWTIRDYRPDDEGHILEFLRLVLGSGGGGFTRNTAFWRWKHFENPFGTSQLLVAAGKEILGLRAFMRWTFATPGGHVRAVRPVDTSTHPRFRRMGIFSQLTQASVERAREDGVNLIFNTPNPQSMAGYLKLGWSRVDRPWLMIRVLRPVGIAATMLALRRRTAISDEDFFYTPPDPIEVLLGDAEDFTKLIERDDALHRHAIRTTRSVQFLDWRYASAPSVRYHALWVQGGSADAAIIFRPKVRNGLREVRLCEVFLSDESGHSVREAIKRLVRVVRADYLVAVAAPGSALWRGLKRSGFIPLPRAGPLFTVRPLAWPADHLDPVRLENWHLSLGDLEIF